VKDSVKKGFSFGLTSGVITTLGMIVGLNSSTHSLLAIIGGIVIIALADALSDSFGMHMAEEFSNGEDQKKVWEATISTFFFKFIFALTFLIPFLLFSLDTAIIICIIYGLFLIGIFSYYIGDSQKISKKKTVLEHLFIAIFVIIITHFVGQLVRTIFY
jgi:vacuolar iron transporter family protein